MGSKVLLTATIMLLVTACGTPSGASWSAESARVAPFEVVLDDGTRITLSEANCDELRDGWLTSWCNGVFSFDPRTLPQTAEDFRTQAHDGRIDGEQLLDVAATFALLQHDYDVCDNVVIATFAASVLGPARGDISQTCREVLREQAAQGVLSLNSPDSGEGIRIRLR